jgi:hypothetical protein
MLGPRKIWQPWSKHFRQLQTDASFDLLTERRRQKLDKKLEKNMTLWSRVARFFLVHDTKTGKNVPK